MNTLAPAIIEPALGISISSRRPGRNALIGDLFQQVFIGIERLPVLRIPAERIGQSNRA
ncbi:hypothetical protein IVB30_32135 [Bradyrhizobium sp. 200]|uniref:hypothetical protein n=1 Tax=Bradyrhizobium sp. 200 TaxID=2782665 RepID=UPI001FFEE59B|nr:hypothetical protein [Bradyrhizobium sp. 200]UPJ47820.1 hypothetical protein IVB30_32135 [Bradyrhizobium sp. 200]